MKKIVLNIILITAFGFGVNAQIVNIPDAGLKQDLINHGITITGPGINIIDLNSDNEIQLSEALAYSGKIQLGLSPSAGFLDMTGLEAFVNITQLHVQYTQVSILDLSLNNSLTEIYIASDVMTLSITLPQITTALLNLTLFGAGISPTTDVTPYINLTDLFLRVPAPSQLDLSALINLETLRCDNSNLTSLTLPATASLVSIDCGMNDLTSLDVSQLSGLEFLNAHINQLTSLDISALTSLNSLACFSNDLTSLNVANGNNTNFTYFNATNNPNLTCIQADDVAWSTSNWPDIDATTSFSTNCSLGINELSSENNGVSSEVGLSSGVEIYPNPTNNMLNIETKATIKEIKIFNLFGELVQIEKSSSFSVTGLSNGVYFINLVTDQGVQQIKFIKK